MVLTGVGFGFQLDAPAARSFMRMLADGMPLSHITETYRPYSEQVDLFLARYKVQWVGRGAYGDVRWWKGKRYVRVSSLGMAAIPGTSVHGYGNAMDCNDPMRSWIRSHPQYGWRFTIFDSVGEEPWHAQYNILRDTQQFATPVAVPTPTPAPAPEPTEEDDDMAAFTTHARSRTTNGAPDGDWTLGHADIGPDLDTFTAPATDSMRRTISDDGKGGVIVEYRGFMVTNIHAVAVAWARTYAKGMGTETSRVTRDEYVEIQRALSLVAQAMAASRLKE